MFDVTAIIEESGKVIVGVAVGLGAPFVPTIKKWLRKKLTVGETISQSGEIQALLGELRVLSSADRVGIYKFHNGGVFSNKRPIWRIACAHESCGPGVKPASADPVFASRVLPLVNHLFDDQTKSSHLSRLDGLYCIKTDDMDSGYSRAALESQGVSYTIQRPVRDRYGLTIGYIAIDFCNFGRSFQLDPAIAGRQGVIEEYAMRIERLFIGR